MTPVVAPTRTLDQRHASLRQANLIRTIRADLKRNLRNRQASIYAVLQLPAPELHSMRVRDLLGALPKWGPVKTRRAMMSVGIAFGKTVGGMTRRQRRDLCRYLRERGVK